MKDLGLINKFKRGEDVIALPYFLVNANLSNNTLSVQKSILVKSSDIKVAHEIGRFLLIDFYIVPIYNNKFTHQYEIDHFNDYIKHFNKYNVAQGYITNLNEPAIEYKTRSEIITEILNEL